MTRHLPRALPGALALILLLGVFAETGDARHRKNRKHRKRIVYKETSRELAQGVVLTQITDPKGPWRVKVIAIDPTAPSTIDVALATDELPGLETTSSMARRHGAIAAINGDYATSSGRPVFAFAEDGELAQTALLWGRNFSTDVGETRSFIGHPPDFSAWAHEADVNETYPVNIVNDGVPELHQMARYSAFGSWEERPIHNACNARLLPTGSPRRLPGTGGIESSHVVDKVVCRGSLYPKGGSVISAQMGGRYSFQIGAMTPGEIVSLGWTLGWPNVADTIGGNPTLIENGQIISGNVYGSGGFFGRAPRTAVASTADGKILFFVVDGRRKRYSVGMTPSEEAKYLMKFGATWALNLDGGGSTTMWAGGKILNRPSSDYERGVSSALLLLPGADPGERWDESPPDPVLLPTEAPSLLPESDALNSSAWFDEISTDPASTGGMLAAFSDGAWLPRGLRAMLDRFRSR